jgi:MFS superfamily sulfate permease-like transporter
MSIPATAKDAANEFPTPRKMRLFQSLRPLTPRGAVRDTIAGLQLAAMNIPQALGYTKIAGTPVVTGFYTLLFPLIAFATFGSSRYLVVAADSATAAILAGGVSAIAPLGSARYLELASLVALITAGFLLIARMLKLGFLADFLSQTVLVGFLTGVGFQVSIAVLGTMLGLNVTAHRTVLQLAQVIRNLPHLNSIALAISVAVVVCVLGLHAVSPKIPGPLVAVAGAIAASAMWNLAARGIAVIGPVAGGMPHFKLPQASWNEIERLIPIAGSCFVMIIAQSAATARIYAQRHHEVLDEDADIVGLAAANAAAALSGTFVVNGSPTQTAMVENSGGQSQIAQLSTAACVVLVLLFATRPLQFLPRCALGALVFAIAVKLINLRALRQILSESPGEFTLAVFTAAVVVVVGVEQGIILAMVVSLLRVVAHSYHPHTAVLVMDGHGVWMLKPAVKGTFTEPGIIVYRFSSPLFYANAGFFTEQIRSLVEPASPRAWCVIVDAGAITHVDYTAARAVIELQADLAKENIELVFAHVQSDLKPDLDRHRLTEAIGPSRIFDTLREAIATVRGRPR